MKIHGPLGWAAAELTPAGKFVARAVTPDRETPQWASRPVDSQQSLADYVASTLKGFDPRTASGAFNIATLLIPGRGPGRPTEGQQALLDAIRYSSTEQRPGNPVSALFNPQAPSTVPLANAIGVPASRDAFAGRPAMREATNPLDRIAGLTDRRGRPGSANDFRRGSSRAGLGSDRGLPLAYLNRPSQAAAMDKIVRANPSERMKAITRILENTAIARRN